MCYILNVPYIETTPEYNDLYLKIVNANIVNNDKVNYYGDDNTSKK